MRGHNDVTEYLRWREEKYARSAFKRRFEEITRTPALVGESSRLASFWRFAIEQREADKDMQDLIAADAGLRLASRLSEEKLRFEHVDELYSIAFAFSALDRKNNWQSPSLSPSEMKKLNAEIDSDWCLLEQRVERLQRHLSR